ncbi:MAG: monovalent cation/H(+) antiporter subunit G [Thermoplasmata archaeon]|nr:monovalent cation/H(+) antiporter subunit G [Thermoplasmata archaeon]
MIWWIIYVCLGIGIVFNLLASLGLLRFPDVYTRLHAGTKCTTFGSIFIATAVMVYGLYEWWKGNDAMISMTVHSFLALLAILITNPTGAHAIARAAYRSGVKPAGAVVDELGGEKDD